MNNYTYKNAPLADRSRPSSFDEMVGQAHLIGKNGALRALVASGRIPSMVFFGPPGCGKTTAASIIASLSGMELRCLNATTAALADIRKIADEADSVIGQGGILLYLDEIQYFNKKQQQSLLEYIEDGRITLISSTTENPYYYIYDALLSRLSVFEFKPVTASDIIPRLRAVFEESGESALSFTGEAYAFIAGCAGGDVRRALTMLELSVNCAKGSGTDTVDEEFVRSLTPSVAAGQFDADGDVHYDLLSALQKSILRLRSGCGGILPRKASRRGRYDLPLPPPNGDSLRGYRAGISDGGGHCARVRRKRKGARTSRSAHSACKRGGNSGKCSEVKHGVLCARPRRRGHTRRARNRGAGNTEIAEVQRIPLPARLRK